MSNEKIDYETQIQDIKLDFNSYYGLSFYTPNNYKKILDILSKMRREKYVNSEQYYKIYNVYKKLGRNYYKIKELIRQEPRNYAQRFISRKKIREFIFKRDDYKCLNCKSENNLSIDHIQPIHNGGENKLSNLQTLCKSCNSKKSTIYFDYR